LISRHSPSLANPFLLGRESLARLWRFEIFDAFKRISDGPGVVVRARREWPWDGWLGVPEVPRDARFVALSVFFDANPTSTCPKVPILKQLVGDEEVMRKQFGRKTA
jgi:hypothetical protein